MNYNPDWRMYEIGAYKGFYFKKFTGITVMGKYYNYVDFEGVLLSVWISIFDTRSYCKHPNVQVSRDPTLGNSLPFCSIGSHFIGDS